MAMETEITCYAKIGNKAGLEKANAKEHQMQAEISGNSKGKVRVRKTTIGDDVKYESAVKEKAPKTEGVDIAIKCGETTQVISKEFFEAFYNVSKRKQVKVRYTYMMRNVTMEADDPNVASTKLPDMKIEVDVFEKDDGSVSDWCKIDVEVDQLMMFLKQNYPEIKDVNLTLPLTKLPLELSEIFIYNDAITLQKRAFLDSLYDTEFTRKD